jgi:hypothetical protein
MNCPADEKPVSEQMMKFYWQYLVIRVTMALARILKLYSNGAYTQRATSRGDRRRGG